MALPGLFFHSKKLLAKEKLARTTTSPLKRLLSIWSPLAEAFNTRPTHKYSFRKNEDVGLFGISELKSHNGFHVLKNKCIDKTDQLIDEASDERRTRKMVQIFDDMSDCLCQVADLAEFIRLAHPDLKYRQAAEDACCTVSGIVEKLNTNVNLYQALKLSTTGGSGGNETVDQHVGKLFLLDSEQSGIHLPETERSTVVQLSSSILHLGQQFVAGTSTPRMIKKTLLPSNLRNIFLSDDDDILINGLYTDSTDPVVREMAYKIFLYPDPNQELLLNKLLESRDDLANVCGFETYAHRALRGGVLDDPIKVITFLETISKDIQKMAEKDFISMAEMKEKEHAVGTLGSWDVPYYTQKAKKDLFRVTFKEYSPYFSLGACMDGLNVLFQSLFGVQLVSSDVLPGECWSSDVYKLSVIHEREGLLGYIYCDFYERSSKPNQDCHFTIRGGRNLPNGTYQLPIVVLMLNLPNPRWSSPSLLTPNMVDNLFHEMGHAMHSMLARTRYQHVSGTRCSTDFAEVPSILMEYFAADTRVLKMFAKHFQTQKPMPDDMLSRLGASKHLFSASETQLQIFYSALDQVLHGRHPLNKSTTQVLADTQVNFYSLPYVPNTAWQLRFSHLVGYGAKYYSYLVSRSLAYSIWQKYFLRDPLSRENGERYRFECLAHGGGKNPKSLVRDFLEVEPQPDILANFVVNEIEYYQDIVNVVVNK